MKSNHPISLGVAEQRIAKSPQFVLFYMSLWIQAGCFAGAVGYPSKC